MPSPHPSHVLVIGAGLAGLSAAESLLQQPGAEHRRITVIDRDDRAGGVIGTERQGGWLLERSADCFLAARPEALALVERLGLVAEVIPVEPRARRALVWDGRRAVPAPAGFRLLAPGRVVPILSSPLLSLQGRIRLLAERLVSVRRPMADDEDESLEHFAVRRLGREAFERLVQPLAAGIWTADPAKLSMAAACGEFLAMEREAGSLWAGERARLARQAGSPVASGARYGQFVTLASGMETLPRRFAEELRRRGVAFVRGAVAAVGRTADGRWRIDTPELTGDSAFADAVIVATPSHVAAGILQPLDAVLASELAAIEYAGSCVVLLGFPRDHVAHPLDAAGLVVPRVTGRRILAVSFSSSKFPGRAPEDRVLLRVFVGGALDPEAMSLGDAALVELARSEVGHLLGVHGKPDLVHVERWGRAMPQVHVGHLGRLARIDAAVERHPGLALAGAAYRGVGIPQVVASGQAAAVRCLTSPPAG